MICPLCGKEATIPIKRMVQATVCGKPILHDVSDIESNPDDLLMLCKAHYERYYDSLGVIWQTQLQLGDTWYYPGNKISDCILCFWKEIDERFDAILKRSNGDRQLRMLMLTEAIEGVLNDTNIQRMKKED